MGGAETQELGGRLGFSPDSARDQTQELGGRPGFSPDSARDLGPVPSLT